jgi:hypothetical protein
MVDRYYTEAVIQFIPPGHFTWRRRNQTWPGGLAMMLRFLGSPLSNDEEAMGGVAAELVDEAVFPIEIGLHRARVDIGALIGTPVAL